LRTTIIKYSPFLLLALWLLLQLSFLKADPDGSINYNSRDVWTDEGLNTSQVRNYVNHYGYDIGECDNLVKTPLFSFSLIPGFELFGTHLWVSRLFVLLFTCLVISVFLKNTHLKHLGLLMLLICFTQFHIFQYSHYGMAQMYGIDFILLSLFFLYKYSQTSNPNPKTSNLFLSVMFSSFAWYAKIQFIYVLIIIPVTLFFYARKDYTDAGKNKYRVLFISLGFTCSFVLFYFLAWYFPNREVYNFILADESAGRLNLATNLFLRAKHHIENAIWIGTLKLYAIALAGALCFLFILWKKITKQYFIVLLFVIVWWLTELHNLLFVQLPMRYLLSLIFSTSFLIAFIMFLFYETGKVAQYIISCSTIIIVAVNLFFLYHGFNERTYSIANINEYIARTTFGESPVLGNWGPALAWDSRAKVTPVSSEYIPDKPRLNHFHPKLIIMEAGEEDSNHTDKTQSVNIRELADSSRTFHVGQYNVVLYWMKKEIYAKD